MLTEEITVYLRDLASTYPAISSVWLIGSRVNRPERPAKDWGFLVFADLETLTALQTDTVFQRSDVDLLIVTDGSHFQSPWPRSDTHGEIKFKRGQIKGASEGGGWDWKETTAGVASYDTSKTTTNGFPIYENAVRVFLR